MLGNSESGLNPGDVSQVVVPFDAININHAFFVFVCPVSRQKCKWIKSSMHFKIKPI